MLQSVNGAPSGRVALVTGGGSGIGEATARRLASDGFAVVLGDRNLSGADRVASALVEAGQAAYACSLDVTELAECEDAVHGVHERWGRLDVVVAAAGVAQSVAPVWALDPAEWRRVLTVNLDGVFHTCRAAIPLLRSSNAGRIVVLASIAGKEGNPGSAAYSASKGAVIAFTKALGKELIDDGVLVNCVAPALISTPMLQGAEQSALNALAAKIPMGRLGEADEVAALVSWLCSAECSFSTGAVFDISGGRATY